MAREIKYYSLTTETFSCYTKTHTKLCRIVTSKRLSDSHLSQLMQEASWFTSHSHDVPYGGV